MNKLDNSTTGLINTLKAQLENNTAFVEPSNIRDIRDVSLLAVHHQVANILYLALQNSSCTDDTAMPQLETIYNQAVAADAAQGYYLEMVKGLLEENGIDYCILKGWVIKALYPSSDLRTSADIDIYIGHENAQRVHDIMLEHGFECTAFGENGSSDDYHMDMYSHIEFHRQLIKNDYPWKEECNRITDRLIHKQGHEYVMSDEDFYIFMICHIAKHMKFGGIGIRAILDVWVYLRHYTDLDFNYINDIMEKCRLSEFHRNVLELCGYWFDGKEGSDKIKALSEYVAMSGWNGTFEQHVSGAAAKMAGDSNSKTVAKLKLYFSAIFWNRERMSVKYPILEKLSVLLPFCWLHRAANALFKKKDVVNEIRTQYDGADMEAGKRINEFRRSIGL